jgi:hypothetical protein
VAAVVVPVLLVIIIAVVAAVVIYRRYKGTVNVKMQIILTMYVLNEFKMNHIMKKIYQRYD